MDVFPFDSDPYPYRGPFQEIPFGVDLRDFVFHDGLPPAVYDADSPSALQGENLFGGFGEYLGNDSFIPATLGATTPTVKLPPMPKMNNPAGVKAYLTEAWRAISVSRGSFSTSDGMGAWARMKTIPTAATSQRAIADIIVAGPLPSTKGATEFYRLCTLMQLSVTKATNESPIEAKAGSMAATIMHNIAKGLQNKAHSANKAIDSVSSNAKAAATVAAKAITNEANAASSAAASAIKDVAAIPGTVSKNISSAVDSVTSVPKSIVEDITDIPKHLADKAGEIADNYIAAAKETLPGMIEDMSKGAENVGKGIGSVFFTGMAALFGLGAIGLAVYSAPEIAATATAYYKRKK